MTEYARPERRRTGVVAARVPLVGRFLALGLAGGWLLAVVRSGSIAAAPLSALVVGGALALVGRALERAPSLGALVIALPGSGVVIGGLCAARAGASSAVETALACGGLGLAFLAPCAAVLVAARAHAEARGWTLLAHSAGRRIVAVSVAWFGLAAYVTAAALALGTNGPPSWVRFAGAFVSGALVLGVAFAVLAREVRARRLLGAIAIGLRGAEPLVDPVRAVGVVTYDLGVGNGDHLVETAPRAPYRDMGHAKCRVIGDPARANAFVRGSIAIELAAMAVGLLFMVTVVASRPTYTVGPQGASSEPNVKVLATDRGNRAAREERLSAWAAPFASAHTSATSNGARGELRNDNDVVAWDLSGETLRYRWSAGGAARIGAITPAAGSGTLGDGVLVVPLVSGGLRCVILRTGAERTIGSGEILVDSATPWAGWTFYALRVYGGPVPVPALLVPWVVQDFEVLEIDPRLAEPRDAVRRASPARRRAIRVEE